MLWGFGHRLVRDFAAHGERNIEMSLIAASLNAGTILVVTVTRKKKSPLKAAGIKQPVIIILTK